MKKKILVSVFLILGIIIATIGITYAFLSYSKTGATINKIKSGNITFNYKEISRGVSIENAMPMTDEQGKRQANYFDFTIKSKTSDTLDIPYYITVNRSGDNLDGIVKLYLTKVDDNNNESEVVLKPFSTLGTYTHNSINIPVSEKLLYTDKVFAGDDNYEQKYRLRMWIDINASYIDQTGGVDTYPLQDKTYSIKVNVYSNGEIATHEQIALRENVNISNIEEGTNILTTSTDTFTASETINPDEEVLTKSITINTENPNSEVTITKRTAWNTNIKRLASSHQIELTYGTNTFDIIVTSENKKETKNYVLVINVSYPSYEVTLTGSNITTSSPVLVKYNENKTKTITVADGYSLSGASCTNGYTIEGTFGNSSIGTMFITIKNNGNIGNSTCTITTTSSVPTVTLSGLYTTFGSGSIEVDSNSSNTVEVTPNEGYYLSSVSCTNGYTTNAQTGIDATNTQTVTITNPGTYNNSTCTFTTNRYYLTSAQIANAFSSSKNVIACDISGEKYYNCSGYSTLQAAFDSRTAGHVVFKNNLSTSEATELVSGKTFTLDLNGNTLTNNNSSGTSVRGITNNGILTINNSSTVNGGIVAPGPAIANTSSSSTLTVNGGSFNSRTSANTGVISVSNGTVVINNGLFNSYHGYAIVNASSSIITINGGQFYSDDNHAIYNSASGTININQTKNNTKVIVQASSESNAVYSGLYNASNGKISITASNANSCSSNINNTTSGLCIYSSNGYTAQNGGAGEIIINGGSFISTSSNAIKNESTGTVKISGGDISSTNKTAIYNNSTGYVYICDGKITSANYDLYNKTTGTIKYTQAPTFSNGKGNPTKNGNGTITQVTTCPF